MRIISCLLVLFINISLFAQVSVPKVFSNHMVLQRDMDIPVWGNAKAGTQITAELGNLRSTTVTDENGKWMIRLPQMKAGGPYTLKIYTGKITKPSIEFDDVLIGDVWLASGQSNMEFQVKKVKNAKEEIKNANYPEIRLFNVPRVKSIKPSSDLSGGSWQVCDSSSVKEISAVAYFFARKIQPDIHVPVGILEAAWGGTPVEAWISRQILISSPLTRQRVLDDDTITKKDFVQDSLNQIRFWDIVYHPKNGTDTIIPRPSYDDSKWSELDMPKTFKDWGMPFYEGMVWLRKSVNIPKDFQGKNLTIDLGHPEMNYSLYFNGKEICKTIWNANPVHSYTIPAKLVKKGRNVIAVRMAVLWGGGGFNPPAEQMYITDGNAKISLAGNWRYKKDLEPKIPKVHYYHYFPLFAYNGMVNPIIPYGIKGFIWYQGEANENEAYNYRTLFPMLINDWRIRWQEGYIPFLYVQLPNYRKAQAQPSDSSSKWAVLRESQELTLSQPNTAMACTIDLGDPSTIHPLDKQDVGYRLALVAEKKVYGKNIVGYSPMFKNFRIEGDHIRISFINTGSGLTTRNNDPLKGFAIAGNNKRFYWASAHIEGNEVIVSSDKVPKPVAVRYAWADNPVCNLIDKEGLPAFPFRTDTWKVITEK